MQITNRLPRPTQEIGNHPVWLPSIGRCLKLEWPRVETKRDWGIKTIRWSHILKSGIPSHLLTNDSDLLKGSLGMSARYLINFFFDKLVQYLEYQQMKIGTNEHSHSLVFQEYSLKLIETRSSFEYNFGLQSLQIIGLSRQANYPLCNVT